MSGANDSSGDPVAAIESQIIGSSRALRRTLELARRAALDSCAILIVGETGVGKENLARLIHAASGRPGRFSAFNCAAVAADLADAELFGHVRGAFTNAVAQRPGLVADSDGGTLFLDEVEELPADLQAKLLRALQEGSVRPVGTDRENRLDLRVVAATNVDLAEAVREGRFRRDLYHRLAGYALLVPPLRERGADVLQLARHFLRELCGSTPPVIGRDAEAVLRAHDWPGNVRELEQVMRTIIFEGSGGRILARHVLSALRIGALPSEKAPTARVLEAVRRHEGLVVDELCVMLRMSRASVYRELDVLLGEGSVTRVRRGQKVIYLAGEHKQKPGLELPGTQTTQSRTSQAPHRGGLEYEPVDKVLELAAVGVSRRTLMEELGMAARSASRLLSRLEAEGQLVPQGEGRFRRYVSSSVT